MVKINKINLRSVIMLGICFLLMNFLLLSAVRADEIVLIANPDTSTNFLSPNEVKSIFLGEKTKWDDGSKIVFVLLMTEEYEKFLKKYLGTTPAQFRHYWKKMVFIGRLKSPKSFKKTEKVLNYVAKTKGALAYIPLYAFDAKVKKILVK